MDKNSKINIIWYNGFKGNWDAGLLASIMDNDERFIQHNTKDNPVFDEAIIILGKQVELEKVRNYLAQFKKGTVILASDEDSEWDWKYVIPSHLKAWTQYYFRNKEEIKERLLLGFPTRLKDIAVNKNQERKYLVSFVGQVQNPHRQSCVNALKEIPNHFIKLADGFGGVNGLEYQDYINIFCQSKVVLCPSGSMCTDSFRTYEALECGALPIVEPRSPRDEKHFNYWKEVSAGILPCVHDWNDIAYILNDEKFIEQKTKECIEWWNNYKVELKQKLLTTLC